MKTTTTERRSSAIERRAERQTRHARALRRAMDRADVSQADIAAACGVAESKVGRWLDPDGLERPQAHELEAMPDDVAVEVLREIAAVHGFSLAPLPVGVREADDAQVLAGAVKEASEMIAASMTLLRPGVTAPREVLERIDREITEALEAACALRTRVRRELAEKDTPSIAIRRVARSGT